MKGRQNMGNGANLKSKIDALQLSTDGLFKLLGSNDPEKRDQFFERLKGITSRADQLLVEHELTVMNTLVTQVAAGARALGEVGQEIAAAAKAGGSR
jgi:hypothetical protein